VAEGGVQHPRGQVGVAARGVEDEKVP